MSIAPVRPAHARAVKSVWWLSCLVAVVGSGCESRQRPASSAGVKVSLPARARRSRPSLRRRTHTPKLRSRRATTAARRQGPPGWRRLDDIDSLVFEGKAGRSAIGNAYGLGGGGEGTGGLAGLYGLRGPSGYATGGLSL